MYEPGFRRLPLADLHGRALEELVRHGEDTIVERKRELPKPPRFGAAVTSFANTYGGWILLGVGDDRRIHGYHKPPKLDLQSHLGAVLRREADPVPPFLADTREIDGKQVVVIRIFASADVPHIVRGTGAIYVRTAKGKEPIDDHRLLLQFARDGRSAEEGARQRLHDLAGISRFLPTPDSLHARPLEAREAFFIMRAAPLTVTPAFADWALTRRGAETCMAMAEQLIPGPRMPYGRESAHPEPLPRGVAAHAMQATSSETYERGIAVIDAGGAVGVGRELRLHEPHHAARVQSITTINGLLDEQIVPLMAALHQLLHEAELCGRIAIDFWMVLPPLAAVGGHRTRSWRVARELVIPDELSQALAVAHEIHRELQRHFGIVKYEG